MKCQALNQDGQRCDNEAQDDYDYFGDPELYREPQAEWVKVELCKEHAIKFPITDDTAVFSTSRRSSR